MLSRRHRNVGYFKIIAAVRAGAIAAALAAINVSSSPGTYGPAQATGTVLKSGKAA
jgi:hypothetical protein